MIALFKGSLIIVDVPPGLLVRLHLVSDSEVMLLSFFRNLDVMRFICRWPFYAPNEY